MLKQLLNKKAEIETRMQAVQEEMQAVNVEIEHLVSQKLVDIRSLTGKEFGVVHLNLDGYKITETVPKKVEWDQEKLNGLFFKILESGDKPSAYMRMKLDIPEKLYDSFPDTIKDIFTEARTVKPGKAQLKFEIMEH